MRCDGRDVIRKATAVDDRFLLKDIFVIDLECQVVDVPVVRLTWVQLTLDGGDSGSGMIMWRTN